MDELIRFLATGGVPLFGSTGLSLGTLLLFVAAGAALSLRPPDEAPSVFMDRRRRVRLFEPPEGRDHNPARTSADPSRGLI